MNIDEMRVMAQGYISSFEGTTAPLLFELHLKGNQVIGIVALFDNLEQKGRVYKNVKKAIRMYRSRIIKIVVMAESWQSSKPNILPSEDPDRFSTVSVNEITATTTNGTSFKLDDDTRVVGENTLLDGSFDPIGGMREILSVAFKRFKTH